MSTITESPEWGEFLKALSFVEPGAFTLFVLLLADGSLEPKLRNELKRGRRLNTVRVSTPDDLRKLAGTILDKTPAVGSAGLWVSVTASDMTRREYWQDAWAYAVARLNENRNRLVQRWPTPVILVGPYWLRDVLREIAPDLWSVRSHVFTLAEELRESLPSTPLESMAFSNDFAGDPELALQEAERLRDIPRAQEQRLTYLNNAAIGFAKNYENNKSEILLKEALVLANNIGYRNAEGQLLMNLGIVFRQKNRWGEAITYFEESLGVFRSLGYRHGEGQSLMNLGNAYGQQCRWDDAIACYGESLTIQRSLGDRHGEGQSLMNLGNVYVQQGRLDDALSCYEESLKVLRSLGDRHGEGQSLINLGIIYSQQGRWDDAITCYKESLIILRSLGDRHGEGLALMNLGTLYHQRGKMSEALVAHSDAYQLLVAVGDNLGAGRTLMNLAIDQAAEGKVEEALSSAHEAVSMLAKTEDKRVLEWAKVVLDRLATFATAK